MAGGISTLRVEISMRGVALGVSFRSVATPRCQLDSISVRAARMTTSFSRPLKPETVDQVMLCRVAVPRWGTRVFGEAAEG